MAVIELVFILGYYVFMYYYALYVVVQNNNRGGYNVGDVLSLPADSESQQYQMVCCVSLLLSFTVENICILILNSGVQFVFFFL